MLLASSQRKMTEPPTSRSIFAPRFRDMSAEALLQHFQTRTTVRYFPVPDLVETARPKIDEILRNRFELNGEQHHLPPAIPWLTNPSSDKEWLILLHKFYYAVGLGMAYDEAANPEYIDKWMALTSSWIRAVPLDFLPSDVTGRRIQNWIFAHYYFVSATRSSCVTPDFYHSFLESLHRQVSYLRDHVTPARNHRTLELCAIFLAAVVFPEFAEAAEWLAWSKTELLNNIQSDLLPDGVHCEQSTDYHHLVLKNYLWIRKLAQLNQIEMPEQFDVLVKRALEFSMYSHRPDGMIPALSDGDSRCFVDLLEQGYDLYGGEDLLYVASQGTKGQPPTTHSKGFSHSGYYTLRSGWGDRGEPYQDERYLIFDCGPLGQGNHGHLDLLSFEAYAYGTPLIVDPGRYTYDESGPVNWRVRFRGTAAHNTVLVDGRNQTRYEWKKNRFKISGSEPDFSMAAFVNKPGLDYLHGVAVSHEYPVIHERKILFINGEYWIVLDLLRAQEPHQYDLLFHLSSAAQGQVSISHAQDTFSVRSPRLVLVQPLVPTVFPSIEEGFVSTSYGTKACAPVVRFRHQALSTCFLTVLYPYKDHVPQISIDAPQLDEMATYHRGDRRTTAHITITHHTGKQDRDEFVFIDQDDGALVPIRTSHVLVSRTDSHGRPRFQYQT